MDDSQMHQMGPMSGMQLTDNIDFALENIDMYTSSFNWSSSRHLTTEMREKLTKTVKWMKKNQNLVLV